MGKDEEDHDRAASPSPSASTFSRDGVRSFLEEAGDIRSD